jgi:hypothetical protein
MAKPGREGERTSSHWLQGAQRNRSAGMRESAIGGQCKCTAPCRARGLSKRIEAQGGPWGCGKAHTTRHVFLQPFFFLFFSYFFFLKLGMAFGRGEKEFRCHLNFPSLKLLLTFKEVCMKFNAKTLLILSLFLGASQTAFASHKERAQELGEKMDQAEQKVKEKTKELNEKAKEKAKEAKNKGQELTDKAKEKAQLTKEESQELIDKAKEKAQETKEKAKEKAAKAINKM